MRRSRRSFLSAAAFLTAGAMTRSHAEEFQFVANYDESKVPKFSLPDPLQFENGSPVTTSEEWPPRRAEIVEMVTRLMYGNIPPFMRAHSIHTETLESCDDAFEGTARRRQIRLYLTEKQARPYVDLLIYLPRERPKATFVGLNFQGNAATTTDPAVHLPAREPWQGDQKQGSRGAQKNRWCFEQVTASGCASVTADYCDLEPDFDDPTRFDRIVDWYGTGDSHNERAFFQRDDSCGVIAEWAWGLSRILDYLQTIPETLDGNRVIVHGHSRLGKTSLLAGAMDERFAGVISNDSGAGGAALSKRAFGETVWRLNNSFPHWFCRNFRQFSNNESALPFDQHEVIALCAPRPVLVASAEKDEWADPRGEFLSTVFAEPVYHLLGRRGLGVELSEFETDGMPALPPLEQPVGVGELRYYIRRGVHDVTPYDWEQWLNFMGNREWTS